MLNGTPCEYCLEEFRNMLCLAIDIYYPDFLYMWNDLDGKETNPFNIAKLLNIISHFLPRNSTLDRLKKSERWHIDFDSIVLPIHTVNRFVRNSINRYTTLTGKDTEPRERKEFSKHINAICFNCHCDNCIVDYFDSNESGIDFKAFLDSGMRYMRLILTRMIIKCLTAKKDTIKKIIGYDKLTDWVEIMAYENIQKDLLGWIKTHLEISYKNNEFMLMSYIEGLHANKLTLQQFYNQIYEIPIQLTGVVPLEHYQNFHSGYITDVISGHPKASNGWMQEAMDEMHQDGVLV